MCVRVWGGDNRIVSPYKVCYFRVVNVDGRIYKLAYKNTDDTRVMLHYKSGIRYIYKNLNKEVSKTHKVYTVNENQRTNGPVNAHLISWPSKAQNIQNLENIW